MKNLENRIDEMINLEKIKNFFINDAVGLGLLKTLIRLAWALIKTCKIRFSNSKRILELEETFNNIIKDEKYIKIYKIDEELSNAFVLSFNDDGIYITSGLYNKCSTDEVIAICLHEYGHLKYKHTYTLFGIDLISNLVLNIIIANIFLKIKNKNEVIYILEFFLPTIISEYLTKYTAYGNFSRNAESSADNYANKYGYGKHLISSLNLMRDESTKAFQKIYGIDIKEAERQYDSLNKSAGYPAFKNRIENISKNIDLPNNIKALESILKGV